jgi:hypothetical protein
MFSCVQTLNKCADDGLGDVALVLPRHRILGCGHKLFAYDYASLSQPDLADDANGTCVGIIRVWLGMCFVCV